MSNLTSSFSTSVSYDTLSQTWRLVDGWGEPRFPTHKERGAVLTVLDLMEEVASLSVTVSSRGVFAAELERFDPRTGAALLTLGARDLVVAPRKSGTVAHGEPVLLLSRDEDSGELVVNETYASPSLNAPDHLFALHADYAPNVQWGTVVVAGDGTPIGFAGLLKTFWRALLFDARKVWR